MTGDFEKQAPILREEAIALSRRFCRASRLDIDPDDIAQDVLLCLWKTLKEGTEVRNLKAWVRRATKNRCISLYRKGQTHGSDPIGEKDFPSTDSSSEKLEERDAERVLHSAMDSLPDGTIRLLGMKSSGMTLDEIAAATGRPKGSVKSSISTARKRLLEQIKMETGDEY